MPPPTLPRNDLKKLTYRLFNAADAIASQHGNLTDAKLKMMAFGEIDRGVNGVVIVEAIRAGLLPQLPVLDPA